MSGALVRWKELNAEDPSTGLALMREVFETMPSQFRLPERWEPTGEEVEQAYALLRKMLAAAILRLLDHDMNRLMQILYRVDVGESKVNQAFQGPFSEVPVQLAELIIERQLQKVFTRRQHS